MCISQAHFGWMVISTHRELQEIDVSSSLTLPKEWLIDPTEVDLATNEIPRYCCMYTVYSNELVQGCLKKVLTRIFWDFHANICPYQKRCFGFIWLISFQTTYCLFILKICGLIAFLKKRT